MSWFKKLIAGEESRQQGPRFGFQVLKNTNTTLPLEPWFDYICGINGRLIEDGNSYLFCQEVWNCRGRDVSFTVWTAKGYRLKDIIYRIPSDTDTPHLGLTMQWTSLAVADQIWHILDVAPQSPADIAGLLPYSDYIIGTPEVILRGESGLYELVQEYLNRPLRLFVYNHEYDVTRELTITPSRNWGGDGILGCVLGYGALHRLPAPLHEPIQAPGETLFDSEQFPPTEPTGLLGGLPTQFQQPPLTPTNFTTPAFAQPPPMLKLTGSPASSTPPPSMGHAHGRHKPKRVHHTALDMDVYLKEGEEKSKELDRGSTPTGNKSLPPPPKGAPPPPRRGTVVKSDAPSPATTPKPQEEQQVQEI
ncbi:hypothetical protein EX30DRAFT_342990 [Ascodesmis nigricans]|uniref:PDZ GRASP-type domain-containing protein n=1 Tax=Ascodesmis nigricans TaxID=341454 RepID=A0A4S2MSA6_9PEZI|nr:hypothetical protein EX30DRAFT_342990 [Ascodesmis nigricans]